jgi:UDP-N-acetyl-D-glucosamine dehydrogenase
VIGLLREKMAVVSYHDPYIPELRHDEWALKSVPDLLAAVADADCVVVITNHTSYNYPAIYGASRLIVDTRNAYGYMLQDREKVELL